MGGGRLGAAQWERAVQEELGGVGGRRWRQGWRGWVQGGRRRGGGRGRRGMLLGLALIGLRENLHEMETRSRWAHLKLNLSILKAILYIFTSEQLIRMQMV